MNQKIFFLSTVFTLISWQGGFAADPNVLGEGKKSTPHAAWTQRPFIGNMVPDTIMRILKDVSLKDGWEFLSVDKTHHDDVDVWRGFASLHGIPLTDSADTAKEVREEIIEESTNAFRAEIESAASMTLELLTHLLQSAQKKPFLWETLITALQERYANHAQPIEEAYEGENSFDGVSEANRRAFLIAVAERVNPDGTPGFGAEDAQERLSLAASEGRLGFTPDRGTPTSAYDYLVKVAARRNPNDTPGLGAEHAQKRLNYVASEGRLGFTNDRGTSTSGYDYLLAVAARVNPDGTPGFGAEDAQERLSLAASEGGLGFTPDRGTSTSGYDYLVEVSKRKNPDGTPGLGAENAQEKLNYVAFIGRLGFTNDRGTSTSGYDYLVEVSKRKNPDGTPGLGAENAQERLSASDSQ